MSATPRWLREKRRRIKECERFVPRLVIPESITGTWREDAADQMLRSRMWTVGGVR